MNATEPFRMSETFETDTLQRSSVAVMTDLGVVIQGPNEVIQQVWGTVSVNREGGEG